MVNFRPPDWMVAQIYFPATTAFTATDTAAALTTLITTQLHDVTVTATYWCCCDAKTTVLLQLMYTVTATNGCC